MNAALRDALGVGLMIALAGALVYMETRPPPEPPTVTLEPLEVTEPWCRHADRLRLGNHQSDSVAVLLVCRYRNGPFPASPER